MSFPMPAFVTLTGADRLDLIPALIRLTIRFPTRVEFGLLIAPEKSGTSRFPDLKTIMAFQRSGLRLSAHICGSLANTILNGGDVDFDLAGFTRTQINLMERHVTKTETECAIRFGQRRGIRTILQCDNRYPDDAQVDWLLDGSFGQGKPVKTVPDMTETAAFCGISGRLSPANFRNILCVAEPQIGGQPFWVDAESALFDADRFSPHRCDVFLNEVFRTKEGEY